jgi:hypothetical protein
MPQYVLVEYQDEKRRREQPADLNRQQPFTLNIVPVNNGQLNQTYQVVASTGP